MDLFAWNARCPHEAVAHIYQPSLLSPLVNKKTKNIYQRGSPTQLFHHFHSDQFMLGSIILLSQSEMQQCGLHVKIWTQTCSKILLENSPQSQINPGGHTNPIWWGKGGEEERIGKGQGTRTTRGRTTPEVA